MQRCQAARLDPAVSAPMGVMGQAALSIRAALLTLAWKLSYPPSQDFLRVVRAASAENMPLGFCVWLRLLLQKAALTVSGELSVMGSGSSCCLKALCVWHIQESHDHSRLGCHRQCLSKAATQLSAPHCQRIQ